MYTAVYTYNRDVTDSLYSIQNSWIGFTELSEVNLIQIVCYEYKILVFCEKSGPKTDAPLASHSDSEFGRTKQILPTERSDLYCSKITTPKEKTVFSPNKVLTVGAKYTLKNLSVNRVSIQSNPAQSRTESDACLDQVHQIEPNRGAGSCGGGKREKGEGRVQESTHFWRRIYI